MPRKAQPRKKLPSGIETSANGNYFYWRCNLTGNETFADKARFADVVKKYGSEEKLVAEYVTQQAKKYLQNGFTAEDVRSLVEANGGDLPRLEVKGKATHTPKKKRGRKPKERASAAMPASGSAADETSLDPSRVVYPWSGNPDYFGGGAGEFNLAEVSKTTCIYPNRYLSELCKGCSIYDVCAFPSKCSEKDWKGSKNRNEVIIKKLDSYG
jgi:hypothetical protein